eukprot:13219890-Alexandrium_andersonii.AAC.1
MELPTGRRKCNTPPSGGLPTASAEHSTARGASAARSVNARTEVEDFLQPARCGRVRSRQIASPSDSQAPSG